MMSTLKNCFIIPVLNDYLVYAPFSGISALTNKSAAIKLKKQLSPFFKHEDTIISQLAKDIEDSALKEPKRITGDLTPEFLGIIPTRSCNSACIYCDFEADVAPHKKMPYDLAIRAVDWYSDLLKSRRKNVMNIHFFGGEPMVARDVVEVVVHRARLLAEKMSLLTCFEISTNGQYEIGDARFLGNYFDRVVLSFDGFRNIQNRHRPMRAGKSSFENTYRTARIISESNSDLYIRCCVSLENVLKIGDFTRWLCENFRIAAINFEALTVSTYSISANLLPPDPVDFAVNFEKSREIALQYGVDVVYASDINEIPVVSSCPVGRDTAIVTPDGQISSCYLQPGKWVQAGLDLSYGSFGRRGEIIIDKGKVEAIRNMVENKPRCNKCFCNWSCAGGCHVGTTFPGCSVDYDNFCKQTRLISALTLLSELDIKEKTEKLLVSADAIKLIVDQKSDCLIDFEY